MPKKIQLPNADHLWVENLLEKIQIKCDAEAARMGSKIPYISVDGVYAEDKAKSDIVWWTNGFWPGICWQMWHYTNNNIYLSLARTCEDELDCAFDRYSGLHHDVGFMWLLSAIADYRLTGNKRSLARGLHAANLLAGRYNPRGHFIRSWNHGDAGWVIVDSLMNIQLLFWASEVSGDPRFTYMAEDHADTLLTYTVRPDGSCNHIISLDPKTGELVDIPEGQGYAPDSSWSRGQSWAVYGYALSYRHTGEKRYLDAAKRVSHYFMSQVALTGNVALLDFRQPDSPVYWDAIAGCCAACGMLEIARSVPECECSFYTQWALRILRATDARFCDWDPARDGIVQMCSGAYHSDKDRHVHMIYADYFLLEAVLRLLNKDELLW